MKSSKKKTAAVPLLTTQTINNVIDRLAWLNEYMGGNVTYNPLAWGEIKAIHKVLLLTQARSTHHALAQLIIAKQELNFLTECDLGVAAQKGEALDPGEVREINAAVEMVEAALWSCINMLVTPDQPTFKILKPYHVEASPFADENPQQLKEAA